MSDFGSYHLLLCLVFKSFIWVAAYRFERPHPGDWNLFLGLLHALVNAKQFGCDIRCDW